MPQVRWVLSDAQFHSKFHVETYGCFTLFPSRRFTTYSLWKRRVTCLDNQSSRSISTCTVSFVLVCTLYKGVFKVGTLRSSRWKIFFGLLVLRFWGYFSWKWLPKHPRLIRNHSYGVWNVSTPDGRWVSRGLFFRDLGLFTFLGAISVEELFSYSSKTFFHDSRRTQSHPKEGRVSRRWTP